MKRNKRTLYATLSVALLGAMSSSFFGTNATTAANSVSMSSWLTPTQIAAQAAADKKKADEAKKTNKPAPAATLTLADSEESAEKAAAAERKSKAEKPVAVPAEDDTHQDQAENKNSSNTSSEKPKEKPQIRSVVASDGATYVFRDDHNDETEINETRLVNGQIKESKIRSIDLAMRRYDSKNSEGTICTGGDDCDMVPAHVRIAAGEDLSRALSRYVEKLEDDQHSKLAKEKKEREERCEEVDIHTPGAGGNADVADAICNAKLLKKKGIEAQEKEDIMSHLKDQIVTLVKDKDNKQSLALAKRIVKATKLNELKVTLDAALYSNVADIQLANAKTDDQRAKSMLAYANQLCPQAQMNFQTQSAYSMNSNMQMQNTSRCNPAAMQYAMMLRSNAMEILTSDMSAVGQYSPTAFANMNFLAQNPMSGGMSYEQLAPTFGEYGDFAKDVYGMTGQNILSGQDRSLLSGLAGMEMLSPSNSQMNQFGMNSGLMNQNNFETDSWRTQQANGARFSMQYPGNQLSIGGNAFGNQQMQMRGQNPGFAAGQPFQNQGFQQPNSGFQQQPNQFQQIRPPQVQGQNQFRQLQLSQPVTSSANIYTAGGSYLPPVQSNLNGMSSRSFSQPVGFQQIRPNAMNGGRQF